MNGLFLNGMLEVLKASADGLARKTSGGGGGNGRQGSGGDDCTPCAAHAYVESLRQAPQPTLRRPIRSPSKGRR